MEALILIVVIILAIIVVLRNPIAKKIKKINDLLNIDRSICDFIETLSGWEISPVENDGLCVVITPVGLPKYNLYITYNKKRPENKDIIRLYHALTDEDSLVTKAHRMNVPVEQLINNNLIRSKREMNNDTFAGNSMQRDENYVGNAMLCAISMVANEKDYYLKASLTNLIPILEKPTAIIDRLALIYAVLTVMRNKNIDKNPYINLLIADRYVSFSNDDEIIRFEKRIEYFIIEIKAEMQHSSFFPNAIINTLRHPNEKPIRSIGNISTIDALRNWGIIIETINRYFD